jgi:type VI secretion system protein ImpL
MQDYEKQWLALFSDIRLARSATLPQTIEQARILSAPDSPLKRLVVAAAKELSFGTAEDAAKAAAEKAAQGAASQALGSLRYGRLFAGAAQPAAKAVRPEDAVEARFAPLRNLAGAQGAAGGAPIDSVLQSMSEFYTQLRAAEEALGRGQVTTALNASGSKLRADADRHPEPVRTVLRDLAQTSSGQAAGAAKENSSMPSSPATSRSSWTPPPGVRVREWKPRRRLRPPSGSISAPRRSATASSSLVRPRRR